MSRPPLEVADISGDYTGCPHPDPDHSYGGARVEYDNGLMSGFLKANESGGSSRRCPYTSGRLACHPHWTAIRENDRNSGFPSSPRRCVRYQNSRGWVDWVNPEEHLAQTISCSRATMRQPTQLQKRMRRFSTTR